MLVFLLSVLDTMESLHLKELLNKTFKSNVCTRRRCVVSFAFLPFYPHWRTPITHWI